MKTLIRNTEDYEENIGFRYWQMHF